MGADGLADGVHLRAAAVEDLDAAEPFRDVDPSVAVDRHALRGPRAVLLDVAAVGVELLDAVGDRVGDEQVT